MNLWPGSRESQRSTRINQRISRKAAGKMSAGNYWHGCHHVAARRRSARRAYRIAVDPGLSAETGESTEESVDSGLRARDESGHGSDRWIRSGKHQVGRKRTD